MSDSVEGPARKCTRVEDTSDEAGVRATEVTEGSRKRDNEFWFEDGTVILVARNVEFRIYKGLLVHHSPVFRDMLSLPQPPDSLEADSPPCSVVPLSDSPEDLRYVLRVYMTCSDLSPFTPDNPLFNLISACIRLGHKYQMTKLLDHSVAYLKSWYPADMEAWQKHWPVLLAGFSDFHAIVVVNLARLTGETSILLAAFLHCHMLEERVLDGFNQVDGSHEDLTLEDLKCCIKAKGELAAASLVIYVCMYQASISDKCATRDTCLTGFREALALLDWYSDIVMKQDPFRPVLRMYETPDVVLCSHCAGLAMERAREAQEEF
ncbi:hypothetical protein LXA43DRAFT_900417 [Ganoderma leucocontextum]|nr:hypothetical protein LXA43DRAFT_900417 [Ganoderma leucocontextum]